MKTIGIKLADGSFYPVLEEGKPSEKTLNLTTAHNNQTKIMVDLYRSADCSMEDAEYVDSLQIENMVAHPNGEPDISFIISLDDENQLSAKIVDPETGNQSNTTISLVSRTMEERLKTDEYGISEDEENSDNSAAVAGLAAGGGLLAAAAALREKDETELFDDKTLEMNTEEPAAGDETVTESGDETISDDFSMPDFGDTTESEPAATDTVADEEDFASGLPDFTEEFAVNDEPAVSEESVESDVPAEDTFAMPDFDESSESSETIESDATAETVTETGDETISDDFALPDFGDETASTEQTLSESSDETISDDFGLPDFGDTSDTTEADITETAATEENLDLPDFDDDEFNSDLSEENTEMKDDDFNFDDLDDTPASSGNGLSFTGLYDKETELGKSDSSFDDDEEIHKKTKRPVIICIICAIICLIATALILFIIPSKYNLFKKPAKTAAPAVTEQTAPAEPEKEPAKPEVPPAKEDEIVIVEKAEEVVPEQPPVAQEKPKSVTHKIKWGDTLWDIADTYYKNPWRYKYIARYNGIKDPDYIISGTTIVIPAE